MNVRVGGVVLTHVIGGVMLTHVIGGVVLTHVICRGGCGWKERGFSVKNSVCG